MKNLKSILAKLIREEFKKSKEQTYIVYYKIGEDREEDEEIKATSKEEAIQKVKDKAPRLSRSFSAKYVGNIERGNKILDKANPKNVDKILKGEKPIYESQNSTNIYSKNSYIKETLEAIIYPNNTISLNIYSPKGGSPVKQTSTISFK